MAVAYDHIAENKKRTWLLALLFPLLFAALAFITIFMVMTLFGSEIFAGNAGAEGMAMGAEESFAISYYLALRFIPFVILLAVIWIVITYFGSGHTFLSQAHAKEIMPEDQKELYRLVENLCITRGLPVPKIYVINDDSLNAFATGRDPQHASIALTKGILQKLDKSELEAVIAHELGHIENRDITIMLIALAGIAFFTLHGEILIRMAGRSGGGRKNNAGVILLIIGGLFLVYGYFLAPLIRLAISRKREYLADASAALTTRNPGALASALEKISQDNRVEILDEHPSMAAMCIETPLEAQQGIFNRLSGLYATHPPIEARIARLREMDGQRDLY